MIEPERILVAGDWHGNTGVAKALVEYAAQGGANVIVHAGDFGHWHSGSGTKAFYAGLHESLVEHDITLYWVDGNHEAHPDIRERLHGSREAAALYKKFPRIIHLPRGFRWEWFGQTWMALGGAASIDRLTRSPGKSWWPEELLSDDDVEHASRPGGVDVIVSHDCPYGVDIPTVGIGEPRDCGWPWITQVESGEHRRKVRDVVNAIRPRLIIHGHYHLRYEAFHELPGGDRTLIQGLDCDGTPMSRSTLFINKP